MTGRHIQPAPVLLLHSSAGTARQWRAAVAALHAAGVPEVHAVEVHGHGAQPAWSGARPLALADEVALLAPWLRRPAGVHLVGHSYGGAVALAAALQWPGRVRSLVVYEPVLFSLLREDGTASAPALASLRGAAAAMRDDVQAGRTLAAAQRFVELWSGPLSWQRLEPERRQAVAARMAAVMAQFDALFDAPFAGADFARLHMPLLLLCGARTVAVTRRIARRLRAAVPHARHETPSAMGHMGPITHAEAFNRRLVEFLAPLATARFLPVSDPALQGVPA